MVCTPDKSAHIIEQTIVYANSYGKKINKAVCSNALYMLYLLRLLIPLRKQKAAILYRCINPKNQSG